MLHTSSKTEKDFVQVGIEVKRVDVKCFSLTREHNEYYLNRVQTLTVIKLIVGDEIIENFHQVGKEIHINCMSKPTMKSGTPNEITINNF